MHWTGLQRALVGGFLFPTDFVHRPLSWCTARPV